MVGLPCWQGLIFLRICHLVGFLKITCEELLWKNTEPDSRSLRYICAFQAPRPGFARLYLNWSGCWLSFGNEFGSPGFTSSWECSRNKPCPPLFALRISFGPHSCWCPSNLRSVPGEDGPCERTCRYWFEKLNQNGQEFRNEAEVKSAIKTFLFLCPCFSSLLPSLTW